MNCKKERGKKDTQVSLSPSNPPSDYLFCIRHFILCIHKSSISFFSAAEGLLYWNTTSFLFTFSPSLCSLPTKQREAPTKCETKTIKVWSRLHLPWNNKSPNLIQPSEMSDGFLCDCLRELAFKECCYKCVIDILTNGKELGKLGRRI